MSNPVGPLEFVTQTAYKALDLALDKPEFLYLASSLYDLSVIEQFTGRDRMGRIRPGDELSATHVKNQFGKYVTEYARIYWTDPERFRPEIGQFHFSEHVEKALTPVEDEEGEFYDPDTLMELARNLVLLKKHDLIREVFRRIDEL